MKFCIDSDVDDNANFNVAFCANLDVDAHQDFYAKLYVYFFFGSD